MRKGALLFTVSVIVALIVGMLSLSSAQNLGQSGGSLDFNVSLGGSQTLNYTIFDAGSSPISFHIILPQFTPIPHNETPAVTASPENGTMQPQKSQTIYVTVHMPSNDSVGLKWDNIIQVIAVSNVSNPGGAVIQGGLGKEVIIYSKKPKSNPFIYVAIAVLVIIVAAGAAAYYVSRNRKGRARAAAARRKQMASVKRLGGRRPSRRRTRRRKQPARRKARKRPGRRRR